MEPYPEQLFIAALQKCSPQEAWLYESGLVNKELLLHGEPQKEESGHLAFGVTEATIWLSPVIGTILVWLFDIGQEALRDRIKQAAGDLLKSKSKGAPPSLFELRSKFDEECRKRGIDEQASLRCSDALVSVLLTHGPLLETRKKP